MALYGRTTTLQPDATTSPWGCLPASCLPSGDHKAGRAARGREATRSRAEEERKVAMRLRAGVARPVRLSKSGALYQRSVTGEEELTPRSLASKTTRRGP